MEGNELKVKSAILLSGGIDSCALAFWKKPDYGIFVNYGQRCSLGEQRAAMAVADDLKIPLNIINIDCSQLGTGDLTGKRRLKIAPVSEWWPYRNQLLITFGLMKGITLGIKELLIGAVKSDSRHKDGSKHFFQLISAVSQFQEGNIRVISPAVELESVELVRKSKVPMSILGWTHSCHKSNTPCGRCNGCLKHLLTKEKLKQI